MHRQKLRVFVPINDLVPGTTIKRSVKYWYWTKVKGLAVVYKDGLEMHSGYYLTPFFKNKPEGDFIELTAVWKMYDNQIGGSYKRWFTSPEDTQCYINLKFGPNSGIMPIEVSLKGD